jgi:hypothetical protein
MASNFSIVQRLPLAPVVALMFGTAVAVVVAAMPASIFESGVAASGLGATLEVARPPFGLRARLLAIFAAFAIVALCTWFGVALIERLLAARPAAGPDSCDDALDLSDFAEPLLPPEPRRRPIFADRELGAPLMSDAALETAAPLSPEPADLTDVSEDRSGLPIGDVSALRAPLDIVEFDLPAVDAETPDIPGESSIDALIRRLEAGLSRRVPSPPPGPSAPGLSASTPRSDDWLIPQNGNEPLDDNTTRAMQTLRRMVG